LYNSGANNGGSPLAFTGILADNLPLDTIFTGGGSKDNNDLNQWQWKIGSPPPGEDIVNAYGASYVAPNAQGVNELSVFVGQDRLSTNGSAAIGFWFFQQDISLNPNGTFKGTHTPGDVLIQINYTGGHSGTVHVYQWDTTAPNNLRELTGTNDVLAAANDSS